MCHFWYDQLKNKYNNKVELIYTDTDSFIIQVETNYIYNDMFENKNSYDFSEYPIDHPNYDITNKKVLMKYKDELKSKIITEFIGLKPKMNSLDYIDNNIIVNKYEYDDIILEGDKRIVLKYDEYNNIILEGDKIFVLKYDEYNNIILEGDKRIVSKYDEHDNNIIVNENTHKGIKNQFV